MTDKSIELPTEPGVKKTVGMRSEAVDWRDALPALEFCCWVVVLLAPLLRWVNGAAVTDDQALIQTALISMALLSALVLRLWNWRRSIIDPLKADGDINDD